MDNSQKTKTYDLEQRTLEYAKRIIRLCKNISGNIENNILSNQLMRSGTSLGANYREANETVTKKDFSFRMRICRKEAKETIYWLQLVIEANPSLEKRVVPLLQETGELLKIFAAIIEKTK